MNKLIDHQVACWEFLRADKFPPILNELGNFALAMAVWFIIYKLGFFYLGLAFAVTLLVAQKVEAYLVGQEWLRNGKRLDMTKRYLLHRYGIR